MSKTVIEAIDAVALAGGVEQSSTSVAKAIDGLEGLVVSNGAAAVTNALKAEGAITVAISDAIDTELDTDGKIADAIDEAVGAVSAEYDAPNDVVTELAELEANYDALVAALVDAGVITLPAP